MIEIEEFQNQLLDWYQKKKRDLPWRQGSDPYHIWVSEIMLQQTRVETVIPYFERFITQFPSIDSLANANEEEVLKAWEGLGYYSRARNLQKGVREVQEKYGGRVPVSKEEILSISGIGPYTAGAVLSIAYGKAEPAVDGNVLRVFSRLLNSFEDVSKAKTKKTIEQTVKNCIPHYAASDFNQALMELGATVCIPRSPRCSQCPVKNHCEARKEGTQTLLPIKAKKKPGKIIYRIGLLIHSENRWAVVQRPSEGLLASMWEFPSIESEELLSNQEWEDKIMREFGLEIKVEKEPWMFVEHTFSHLKWQLSMYRFEKQNLVVAKDQESLPSNWQWVNREQMERLSFPKAYKQVVKKIDNP